uniref:Nephrocystin 3-like N-terminal domain-containing protein n=1 Tax=Mycena chlorophos TaxID=658473 RepID=A0ABQ0L007_MYCCL|nr:predicted protein [Mycena chlorophos]
MYHLFHALESKFSDAVCDSLNGSRNGPASRTARAGHTLLDLALDHDARMANQQIYMTGGTGGSGGSTPGALGGIGYGPTVTLDNNQISSLHIGLEGLDEETRKILKWLSPLNFFPKHYETARARQEETGEWFLQHQQFKSWVTSPKQMVLVGHGLRTGKTVLSSKVVDYFRQLQTRNHTIGLGFLYLSYKDQSAQDLHNLLAALWMQLLLNRNINPARAVYNSHKQTETSPSSKEIISQITALSQQYAVIYVIIDALDEYVGEKDSLIKTILQFGLHVKLLVMTGSNDFKYLETQISKLEITPDYQDIKKFVMARVESPSHLQILVKNHSTLKEEILDSITKVADGR